MREMVQLRSHEAHLACYKNVIRRVDGHARENPQGETSFAHNFLSPSPNQPENISFSQRKNRDIHTALVRAMNLRCRAANGDA